MNLLKSSNISDLHFMQSEDEEQPDRPECTEAQLADRKLLDSSLNNRLEPAPKHAFKPYQRRTDTAPYTSPNRYELDFNITDDNKNLAHSSYEFLRMMGMFVMHVGSNPAVNGDTSQMMRTYTPTLMRIQPQPTSEKEALSNNDQWLGQQQAQSEPEEEEVERTPIQQLPIVVKHHPKNETKNIPKNYGKAIITFIERNRQRVNRLCEGRDYCYADIIGEFRHRKRNINTIEHLRELWLSSRYAREMRILSNLFLRKHALQYIFNSRITNFSSHIKYRHKLLEGVSCPNEFNNIKDY